MKRLPMKTILKSNETLEVFVIIISSMEAAHQMVCTFQWLVSGVGGWRVAGYVA